MTEGHALDFGLGEGSPLARLYELEAWVLLLGVGHDSNTSLHLAEYRASYPSRRIVRAGAPLLINSQRVWVAMQDIDLDSDDFPGIGSAFERTTGLARRSRVGEAQTVLMPQRSLVDFGVQWIETNRR